ncbi:alpha/beta hydrolase [Vallicoccus soli]|uniref:Alpha/beta hydrolase n=1 Tax=Vallicoccus soli TaxID=2339232 RepID=A0A3A3ZIX4_9ACTN|nr:alpha/beta hydrolase [Vallicoccus soli]
MGLLAAAALAVPTTAATAAPAPVAPAPTAPAASGGTVDWGPCEDGTLQAYGAECGFVSVPLDHDRPRGEQIRLAVSRVEHTVPDDEYQGVMLVNPGGPGGSGLVFSVLQTFVPDGAGAAYDWIGFDPRGVGASEPSLSCDPGYFGYDRPPYDPVTPAVERAWLRRAAGYAADCARAGGDLLEHLTTRDNVRDMEHIRRALGERRINFYGFSYGTYLGQVYATLYPQRVRRMVLDSNVDPRNVWYRANLNQDVAFDRNIQLFFAWVARYDEVYHLGRSRKAVSARWYAEKAELRDAPAAGLVGPSEWTDIVLGAGYDEGAWPGTAELFAAWAHDGDAQALVEAYGEPEDIEGGYPVYLGTQCTDVQWPTSWEQWRRDNTRIAERAPFETWANAWYNAPCLFWPATADRPVRVDGRRAPAVLLVSETLDAATPYAGNLEVRERFPRSRLIATEGGATHANSLAGNACVDDRIAAYLATGELPRRVRGRTADVVCERLPEPVPAAPAAAARTLGATPAPAPAPAQDGLRDALRAETYGR